MATRQGRPGPGAGGAAPLPLRGPSQRVTGCRERPWLGSFDSQTPLCEHPGCVGGRRLPRGDVIDIDRCQGTVSGLDVRGRQLPPLRRPGTRQPAGGCRDRRLTSPGGQGLPLLLPGRRPTLPQRRQGEIFCEQSYPKPQALRTAVASGHCHRVPDHHLSSPYGRSGAGSGRRGPARWRRTRARRWPAQRRGTDRPGQGDALRFWSTCPDCSLCLGSMYTWQPAILGVIVQGPKAVLALQLTCGLLRSALRLVVRSPGGVRTHIGTTVRGSRHNKYADTRVTYRAFFPCAISMLGAVGGSPARGRLRQRSRRALVGMSEARGVVPRQGLRS